MQLPRLAVSLACLAQASALFVAPDSPCGTLCGNVNDQTSVNDIVCKESDYKKDVGVIYQQCLTCQLSSEYYDKKNETDTEWMLYNFRYAVSHCLFGVPKNDDIVNTPCLTSRACGPFRDAILYKDLSSKVGGYDYCDIWPVSDVSDFTGCTECLQIDDKGYLANFITVLQAGCEQKPIPGHLISIEGNPFSTDDVNVTTPSAVGEVDPAWFDNGPLNLGAKVGIAVGGLALVLFVAGFCIICNGRRRRRKFLKTLETKQTNNSWPSPLAITKDMHGTPVSQRPLRNWDESPMSAHEKPFPRYISPYSTQYSSPVSATEAQLANWPVMAHEQFQQAMQQQAMQQQAMQQHAMEQQAMHQQAMQQAMHQRGGEDSPRIGVAYGGDESSIDSSKGKDASTHEAYEMHPVDNKHGGIGIYEQDDYINYLPDQQQPQGFWHQGYYYQGQAPPPNNTH